LGCPQPKLIIKIRVIMKKAIDIMEYDNDTKVVITTVSKDGVPTIEEYWYKNGAKGLAILKGVK